MECHEELNSLNKSHPDQNLNSFKLQALFDKHQQLAQSKSELNHVLSVRIKQFEGSFRSSISSHSHSSKHSRRTLVSLGETRMDLMAKAIELKFSNKKPDIKEEQLNLDE